ncbi:MAG: hypothetical protein U1F35_17755 [Steroidobacteraceae bacterium]
MVSHVVKLVVVGSLVWGSWSRYAERPVLPPDGEIAPQEPIQTWIEGTDPIHLGQWTLTPRAHYDVTARVLGRENYHFDALSDLIPEDLALGWGPMSDNQLLRRVEISQSGRFYYWRVPDVAGMDLQSIATHSANTHVIPNDGVVARELSSLRVGQVVHLEGDLVDGTREDGRWIRSSLVRNDTGAGACEVLLVRSVQVL